MGRAFRFNRASRRQSFQTPYSRACFNCSKVLRPHELVDMRTKFTFQDHKVNYLECFPFAGAVIKKYDFPKLCQVCCTRLKSAFIGKNSLTVPKEEKVIVAETVIKLESLSPSKVDVALEIKKETVSETYIPKEFDFQAYMVKREASDLYCSFESISKGKTVILPQKEQMKLGYHTSIIKTEPDITVMNSDAVVKMEPETDESAKPKVGDYLKTPTFQIHNQSISQLNIKTYYSKQELVDDIKIECEEIQSPEKNGIEPNDVVSKTVENIKLEDDNAKLTSNETKIISKSVISIKENTEKPNVFHLPSPQTFTSPHFQCLIISEKLKRKEYVFGPTAEQKFNTLPYFKEIFKTGPTKLLSKMNGFTGCTKCWRVYQKATQWPIHLLENHRCVTKELLTVALLQGLLKKSNYKLGNCNVKKMHPVERKFFWDIYRMENDEITQVNGYVACKKCYAVHRTHQSTELSEHRCVKASYNVAAIAQHQQQPSVTEIPEKIKTKQLHFFESSNPDDIVWKIFRNIGSFTGFKVIAIDDVVGCSICRYITKFESWYRLCQHACVKDVERITSVSATPFVVSLKLMKNEYQLGTEKIDGSQQFCEIFTTDKLVKVNGYAGCMHCLSAVRYCDTGIFTSNDHDHSCTTSISHRIALSPSLLHDQPQIISYKLKIKEYQFAAAPQSPNDIWTVFRRIEKIENNVAKKIFAFVGCVRCMEVLRYNRYNTRVLEDHKCGWFSRDDELLAEPKQAGKTKTTDINANKLKPIENRNLIVKPSPKISKNDIIHCEFTETWDCIQAKLKSKEYHLGVDSIFGSFCEILKSNVEKPVKLNGLVACKTCFSIKYYRKGLIHEESHDCKKFPISATGSLTVSVAVSTEEWPVTTDKLKKNEYKLGELAVRGSFYEIFKVESENLIKLKDVVACKYCSSIRTYEAGHKHYLYHECEDAAFTESSKTHYLPLITNLLRRKEYLLGKKSVFGSFCDIFKLNDDRLLKFKGKVACRKCFAVQYYQEGDKVEDKHVCGSEQPVKSLAKPKVSVAPEPSQLSVALSSENWKAVAEKLKQKDYQLGEKIIFGNFCEVFLLENEKPVKIIGMIACKVCQCLKPYQSGMSVQKFRHKCVPLNTGLPNPATKENKLSGNLITTTVQANDANVPAPKPSEKWNFVVTKLRRKEYKLGAKAVAGNFCAIYKEYGGRFVKIEFLIACRKCLCVRYYRGVNSANILKHICAPASDQGQPTTGPNLVGVQDKSTAAPQTFTIVGRNMKINPSQPTTVNHSVKLSEDVRRLLVNTANQSKQSQVNKQAFVITKGPATVLGQHKNIYVPTTVKREEIKLNGIGKLPDTVVIKKEVDCESVPNFTPMNKFWPMSYAPQKSTVLEKHSLVPVIKEEPEDFESRIMNYAISAVAEKKIKLENDTTVPTNQSAVLQLSAIKQTMANIKFNAIKNLKSTPALKKVQLNKHTLANTRTPVPVNHVNYGNIQITIKQEKIEKSNSTSTLGTKQIKLEKDTTVPNNQNIQRQSFVIRQKPKDSELKTTSNSGSIITLHKVHPKKQSLVTANNNHYGGLLTHDSNLITAIKEEIVETSNIDDHNEFKVTKKQTLGTTHNNHHYGNMLTAIKEEIVETSNIDDHSGIKTNSSFPLYRIHPNKPKTHNIHNQGNLLIKIKEEQIEKSTMDDFSRLKYNSIVGTKQIKLEKQVPVPTSQHIKQPSFAVRQKLKNIEFKSTNQSSPALPLNKNILITANATHNYGNLLTTIKQEIEKSIAVDAKSTHKTNICAVCLSNINILYQMQNRKFLHKGQFISLLQCYKVLYATDSPKSLMVCEMCETRLQHDFLSHQQLKELNTKLISTAPVPRQSINPAKVAFQQLVKMENSNRKPVTQIKQHLNPTNPQQTSISYIKNGGSLRPSAIMPGKIQPTSISTSSNTTVKQAKSGMIHIATSSGFNIKSNATVPLRQTKQEQITLRSNQISTHNPKTAVAPKKLPVNYSSSDGESDSNNETVLNTFCILCLSNINVLRRMHRRKFMHKGRLISLRKSYQVRTGIKITDIGRQMICEMCELQLKYNFDEGEPVKKAKFELGTSSSATKGVPAIKKECSKTANPIAQTTILKFSRYADIVNSLKRKLPMSPS